jgi:hypothetical protein
MYKLNIPYLWLLKKCLNTQSVGFYSFYLPVFGEVPLFS